MESSLPPPDKAGLKPSFRKPTGDSANRKYRRHSPVNKSDSSSSGGTGMDAYGSEYRNQSLLHGPRHEWSYSPPHSREDKTRDFSDQRRRDTEKELERDSIRNRSSRGYDSQKYSERHFYGNAHDHRRHDDHNRHRRHADEDNRNYLRSTRSGRESRNGTVDTGSKQVGLSRDYDDISEKDKRRERETRYSRKDYHRSPRSKNYHAEEYRSVQERDTSASQQRESEKSSKKEHENLVQKRKHLEREDEKQREKHTREQEFQTERISLFSERVSDGRNEVHKSSSDSVGKQSFSLEPKSSQLEHGSASNDLSMSGPGPAEETHEKVNDVLIMNSTTNNAGGTNDVNSAKVAALKAAELVNKNLVGFGGTGFLSTDQKKKLLWGNKKNSSTEETSSSRWDLHMFQDRDRQEKFNRLMGVKGNAAAECQLDGKDGNLQAKRQEELDTDLEKQYTAGLRRRDGRTVGLGL